VSGHVVLNLLLIKFLQVYYHWITLNNTMLC